MTLPLSLSLFIRYNLYNYIISPPPKKTKNNNILQNILRTTYPWPSTKIKNFFFFKHFLKLPNLTLSVSLISRHFEFHTRALFIIERYSRDFHMGAANPSPPPPPRRWFKVNRKKRGSERVLVEARHSPTFRQPILSPMPLPEGRSP